MTDYLQYCETLFDESVREASGKGSVPFVAEHFSSLGLQEILEALSEKQQAYKENSTSLNRANLIYTIAFARDLQHRLRSSSGMRRKALKTHAQLTSTTRVKALKSALKDNKLF